MHSMMKMTHKYAVDQHIKNSFDFSKILPITDDELCKFNVNKYRNLLINNYYNFVFLD